MHNYTETVKITTLFYNSYKINWHIVLFSKSELSDINNVTKACVK